MKIVTGYLVEAFANRMMNIHPSLLPSFPGLDVQRRQSSGDCKLAGCTVHFVTEGVDEGADHSSSGGSRFSMRDCSRHTGRSEP